MKVSQMFTLLVLLALCACANPDRARPVRSPDDGSNVLWQIPNLKDK